MGYMDHMQPPHSCQWRETLTWAEKRVVKLAQELQLKYWPKLSSFHIRSFRWSCAPLVLVQHILSSACHRPPKVVLCFFFSFFADPFPKSPSCYDLFQFLDYPMVLMCNCTTVRYGNMSRNHHITILMRLKVL